MRSTNRFWLAAILAVFALSSSLLACDKGDNGDEGEEQEYSPPPDPGADLPQHQPADLFTLDQPYPSPFLVNAESVGALESMGQHMTWGSLPRYQFRLPNHPTENAFDWRSSECLYQARDNGEWNVECVLRADPNQTTNAAHLQAVVDAVRAKFGEPSEQGQSVFGMEYTWRVSEDGRTRVRVFEMDASDWGAIQVHVKYSYL